MSLSTLSPKQAEVLSFIESAIAEDGRPPSLREIAAHCAKSGQPLAIGTIQDHVQALIQKGYLQKDAGRARSLRLAHQAQALSIPILGSIPAGRPLEAIEDSQGSLAMAAPSTKTPSQNLFALKVRGDSMQDAGIMHGDFVIVERTSEGRHGEIVVALIDGEATVKRLEKRGPKARLIAENPKYAPIELDPARENLIQGRVVGVQRFY